LWDVHFVVLLFLGQVLPLVGMVDENYSWVPLLFIGSACSDTVSEVSMASGL